MSDASDLARGLDKPPAPAAGSGGPSPGRPTQGFARHWGSVIILASLSVSAADADIYVIELSPPIVGVEVRVGDVVVGVTDDTGRVAVDLEPGTHIVKLQKEGRRLQITRRFESRISQQFIRVSGTDLGAETKGYILETEVDAARIYVDGLYEGRTDSLGRIELPLIEGREVHVEARKDGYRTREGVFQTEPGIDFLPPLILDRIEPVLDHPSKPPAAEAPRVDRSPKVPAEVAAKEDSSPVEASNPGESALKRPTVTETETAEEPADLTPGVPARTERELPQLQEEPLAESLPPATSSASGPTLPWALPVLGSVVLAIAVATLLWRRGRRSASRSQSAWADDDAHKPEVGPGEIRVPNYRLLDRADDSAPGTETYLAESIDQEGGPFIVKLPMRGGVLDPEAVARFLRHANQSKRLANRHIAPVYDAGVDAKEERPYYVTARNEGLTLRQYLERYGSLPEVEAIGQVILPILHALHYAHSLAPAVVHRHLQPETVQVTFDEKGSIQDLKLLDYGIDIGPGTGTRGLPYTAPEVLEGHSPSPASDLFSLGVLFVEVLTGQLPRLREAPDGEFTPSLPNASAPIARILNGLLPRDPGKRHSSAHQAIAEVREALLSERREMTSRLHTPTTETESGLS